MAAAVTDESPDVKKKGHGADCRERRLAALPHWDEMEIRLQHRWLPDQIIDWHRRAYPTERVPSRRTLYRFLQDKDESWYVEQLLIDQAVMKRVPRIMILERQANLIEMQTRRLNGALSVEAKMGGLLYPEARANMELLDRMLERHKITQQELGILPKVTPAAGKDGNPSDADDKSTQVRELKDLVNRFVELPEGEFIPHIVQLLGPPPVKQPISIEGTVLEKKLLQSDDAPPRG